MTSETVRAFLFGAAIAAPVGPIALLLIHVGLNHRLAAALRAALGVALADLTYALLALAAGAELARRLEAHQYAFRVASSGLLIVLGVWLAANSVLRADTAASTSAPRAPGPLELYLLTLANPLTIVLFAAFSGQMSIQRDFGAVLHGSLWLFLGSLSVQTAYAGFGAVLRRWIAAPEAVRKINALSGIVIAVFGAWESESRWARGSSLACATEANSQAAASTLEAVEEALAELRYLGRHHELAIGLARVALKVLLVVVLGRVKDAGRG